MSIRTVLDLDSVVLAGHSPKHYEIVPGADLIIQALEKRGINENKIAFANIREQVALPHQGQKIKATAKARLLIDAALAKLEKCHAIKSIAVAPRRSVLVIGTTPGGIFAAGRLLARGYRVLLVEKESAIRQQSATDPDILPTLTGVQSDERARFLFEASVSEVSGWCGDFTVLLDTKAGQEEIPVGGILLAVGDDTAWIEELRPILQLDTDQEGFLQSYGLAGRTRELGVCFIPRGNGSDGVSANMAAAGMALRTLTALLAQSEIHHPVLVSEVDETACGGCGTCVKTCAFAASSIDVTRKVSVIDPRRCKGCGNCVVACPTGARDLVSFPETYVFQAIDALSHGSSDDSEPKVLAFLCNGCGYPAADAAGELSRHSPDARYSAGVLPIRVECGGNIDTQYILKAFGEGFDGVALSICRDGHCHHVVGNTDMERRVGLFREVLRSRGIDAERMRVIRVSPHEGDVFSQEINSFCTDLESTSRKGRQ